MKQSRTTNRRLSCATTHASREPIEMSFARIGSSTALPLALALLEELELALALATFNLVVASLAEAPAAAFKSMRANCVCSPRPPTPHISAAPHAHTLPSAQSTRQLDAHADIRTAAPAGRRPNVCALPNGRRPKQCTAPSRAAPTTKAAPTSMSIAWRMMTVGVREKDEADGKGGEDGAAADDDAAGAEDEDADDDEARLSSVPLVDQAQQQPSASSAANTCMSAATLTNRGGAADATPARGKRMGVGYTTA